MFRHATLLETVVALLAGFIAAWLVILALEIAIPVDGLRQPIEAAASRALGRDVRIGGALTLRPALNPTLVAHDVRITGPAGEDDRLRADRVSIRLAPVDLLRGEPRSKWLLIEDAAIHLEAPQLPAGGPELAHEDEMDATSRLLSAAAELLAQQPDLRQLVLRRIKLSYRVDSTTPRYQANLDEVSIGTRRGQPLKVVLQGRFQQQPYRIDITGAPLADLLTSAVSWPLQAVVSVADMRWVLGVDLEASGQGLELRFRLQADWPAAFARFVTGPGRAPLAGQLLLPADPGQPLAGELQLPALDAVVRWSNGTGPARDTAGQPGAVRVPLTLSLADVPFTGQLLVAGDDADAGVELVLSATDVDAGRLLTALTGTAAVRGQIQQLGLRAGLRGGGTPVIANRFSLALEANGAGLSYGNAAGDRPVDVTLDSLALTLPAGKSLAMRAQGALLAEPVSIEFTAGGLQALLEEESWPFTLSATGSGAVLDISGPLATRDTQAETRLHVGLYGQRIGDLAAWLGVSPCAEASYKLRGQLVLAEDIGRLQFLQAQTNGTRLNGELDWSGDDWSGLLHAVLRFEELDPADIEILIPLLKQDTAEGTAGALAIDIPAFPRRIEITNADIDLAIDTILLKLLDITEVTIATKIREGKLQRSPFSARIGNAAFRGYLDPEAAETAVVFENEEDDGAAGNRVDKLFSSAVHWVGSAAVVPLRWIFRKKLSARDLADCQMPADEAGTRPE